MAMSEQTASTPSDCDPRWMPDPNVRFVAECARWEALALCIECAYDTPSWIGEVGTKIE